MKIHIGDVLKLYSTGDLYQIDDVYFDIGDDGMYRAYIDVTNVSKDKKEKYTLFCIEVLIRSCDLYPPSKEKLIKRYKDKERSHEDLSR